MSKAVLKYMSGYYVEVGSDLYYKYIDLATDNGARPLTSSRPAHDDFGVTVSANDNLVRVTNASELKSFSTDSMNKVHSALCMGIDGLLKVINLPKVSPSIREFVSDRLDELINEQYSDAKGYQGLKDRGWTDQQIIEWYNGKSLTAAPAVPDKPGDTKPVTAGEMLKRGQDILEQRGKQRDSDDGERSMKRTVDAFNALFGKDLTEVEGWMFMVCLKAARSAQGGFNLDDYEDGMNYFALAGEAGQVKND